MKAVSLWQPWASGIALGLKHFETRSWSTSYRGPIAIHAAKRWSTSQQTFYSTERESGRLPRELPFGAIVATAVLFAVLPTELAILLPELADGSVERLYGDYRPGRFAWELFHVVALRTPIPFRGAQGLFEVPDELIERARAA